MSHYTFLFLIIVMAHNSANAITPNAFCHCPVVDLVGTPMNKSSYKKLPYSGKTSNKECSRLTQLIFNEQVEIKEQHGNEVRIQITHWYHEAGTPAIKQTEYWAQACCFTRFSDIKNSQLRAIPNPVYFATKIIPLGPIATLIDAVQINTTIYCAGTRFVKKALQNNENYVFVYAYCPTLKKVKTLALSKNICVEEIPTDSDNKRNLFLDILKNWVHKGDKAIPYVLGGASIGLPLSDDTIYTKTMKKNGSQSLTFYRKNSHYPPAVGIDCAHTIARAAQIAGIPFFVKNTTTIRSTFPALTPEQTIENGDIIVWKGHTVVISDVQKGLIIEARGYDHGYGKVQEIPLCEQFKNIHTVKQLAAAYFDKKKIIRLNKKGEQVQVIDDLIIIKLPV